MNRTCGGFHIFGAHTIIMCSEKFGKSHRKIAEIGFICLQRGLAIKARGHRNRMGRGTCPSYGALESLRQYIVERQTSMPWYTFSGIYLIGWSALLVHCLFRREFFPIFGRRWGTKALWLFTFVFLNPLLTLIYFVFGFLLSRDSILANRAAPQDASGGADEPRATKEKPQPAEKSKAGGHGGSLRAVLTGLGSAAAIASIGVVLVLFELPLGAGKAEPIVIGTINAKNNTQTLSSTSAESAGRVSMRNVLVICQSPGDLLDLTMREFRKSLAQLPCVSEVAYCPFGTRPKPGGRLPDVFIIVNMSVVNEKSFICSQYFKAVIKWTAGSSIFAGTSVSDQRGALEVVRFDIESLLEHESETFGIERPQAKCKLAADSICSEMTSSISKQFENLLDKYGRMPESPRVLEGTYHEPPEFSFLKTGQAQQVISGYGLLKSNRSVWQFTDKRDIDKAVTAYRDELKVLGWEQEELGKEYLRMQNQNQRIHIFRLRQRDCKAGTIFWSESDKTASGAKLVADYESNFTDDQMQKAMDALLNSNAEVKTLLVFEKYFHTPMQLERLESIIEQSPVHTLDEYLMLARYWAQRGRMDKGRASLLQARAMQRTGKSHNARAEEIKNLAEKLGDESLAKVPLDEEIFRQVGFINPQQLKEPIKMEKSMDEPVLFYRPLGDGNLQTFALRVIRSQESSLSAPYHLLIVESRKGSSRSSENSGRIKSGNVWAADTSINALADESKSLQIQVKSLDGEHFLFTITP